MYEILGWQEVHLVTGRLLVSLSIKLSKFSFALCASVWSSLICTPAATYAEINHLGLSLNQYEWPAVGSWPS